MKSIFKNKWLLSAALVSATMVGCDDLTEINIDPNSPTSVPASNLVTQGEYALYNTVHGRGLNGEWGLLMTQQWSQNEYAEDSRYVATSSSFDGTWSSFYTGVLNELKTAQRLIEADENVPGPIKTNQLAILDIIISDAFHTMTDMWGDIPYTEAISTDFPNPSYDSQSAIYADLLATVDAAVSSLNASSSSFSSGDIIYNGDVTSWKKAGASLLMRMAMRVADVDNGLAAQYVQKAAGYGVITDNSENAIFSFDGSDPTLSNPLWIDMAINNRDDFAVSDVLVDNLEGDPRLAVYAKVNAEGIIRGLPYGLTDAEAFALKSVTSRPSDLVRSPDAPHVIIDAAEVYFLTAEAIERGYLSGDAAAAYAAGIEASMNYWGITDGIADYVAAHPYDSANWKESLGMQKWIAFYANGVQGWAEWRRLDYPVLAVPAAAANPTIPTRLPYPISEDTNNGSQLDAVTTNINDISSKLWWDVN
ncbi:SusD/RagB family nutrient-binding outer membrane lipoprotein [Jiulongibacter sp. NS-SX5]|uniref:SusD/RagB family nutrient-binding outer membrane lipoprotein n=1 Tax=Jiulongibacter sp. NS-SX5 TaxID=3463854 RepID=UPI0040597F5C